MDAKKINKLMGATGFRTGDAFNDPSQNVNVTQHGNHHFNTAGNPQKFQKGGMVNTLLEPGEMVFPTTTPGLQSLNSSIPRFQSGGSVDFSGIAEEIGQNPVVVMMPGGGGQQKQSINNSSTAPTPQLSNGPSMASLTDVINRVSWSNVF